MREGPAALAVAQRVCGLGIEKRMSPRLPDAGLDLRDAVESFEEIEV